MAVFALTNATIIVGAVDLSGYSNNVELSTSVDQLDATTFSSSGYKTTAGGLRSVSSKIAGFWEAGSASVVDDALWATFGASSGIQTVSPAGAAVGDVAYFTKLVRPTYSVKGNVGELLGFESSGEGDGTALVRGKVANNSARTATATTASTLLSAPTATQRAYCALHVLSVSGTSTPTMTVTLQSDDATGFPSPTTVATSSAITAVGSQLLTGALGATALEPYYRLSIVISGTTPSFLLVASIGVA